LRRFLICLAAGALAVVAACSKPAPPPARPAAPAARSDPAVRLPAPKAGLWRSMTRAEGAKPAPAETCMDGKAADPNEEPGCGAFTVSRGPGGAVVFDGQCVNNGVAAKSHVVMSGDYSRAYVSDTTTTLSNPGEPDVVTRTHTTWTYAGPHCPGR
jgi:hypothetical protein